MLAFEENIKKIVGSKNLLLSKEKLEAQTQNTLNAPHNVLGVIFATKREQIPKIVALAHQENTPLYTVSTGHNWGYGCQLPNSKESYILNLSLLTEISIIDKDLGLFDIEPGVTQDIMYQFLQKNNLDFMIPTTGAGPSCSLLGNALDRGYGLTPTVDHISAIITVEAVLADGSIYKSPLAEHGSDYLSKFHRNGLGPHISALFAQSNYGVVTQATLQLCKKQDGILSFMFLLNETSQLETVTVHMRNILQDFKGSVHSINLMNRNRVLTTLQEDSQDYHMMGLADKFVTHMLKTDKMAWMGIGAIYAPKEVTPSIKKMIQKMLQKDVDRLTFFSEKKIKVIKKAVSYVPFLKNNLLIQNNLKLLTNLFAILSGTPRDFGLSLAYSQQKPCDPFSNPLNPSRDNVGMKWISPLIPMVPEQIIKYHEAVTLISKEFQIPARITLNTLSPLCFDSTLPIFFEKGNLESEQKANDYFQALLKEFKRLGLYPYRLDIETQQRDITKEKVCWDVAYKIKQSLDPKGILSPGRYSLMED